MFIISFMEILSNKDSGCFPTYAPPFMGQSVFPSFFPHLTKEFCPFLPYLRTIHRFFILYSLFHFKPYVFFIDSVSRFLKIHYMTVNATLFFSPIYFPIFLLIIFLCP